MNNKNKRAYLLIPKGHAVEPWYKKPRYKITPTIRNTFQWPLEILLYSSPYYLHHSQMYPL